MEGTEDTILAIDIGGSHIKATLLNEAGDMLKDYERMITPVPANPENIMHTIKALSQNLPGYTKVSVGFPGYVKDGIVITAPNLDKEGWKNFNLSEQLAIQSGKPVKVVNDADLQGIGVADGKGFELIITLGTGFGTAFLKDGKLLPHLEMAHHPISKSKTYDEYIGEKALESVGEKKWNKRMKKVLVVLKTVFNYDHLYISGGNASKLHINNGPDLTIVTNKDGIKGGAKLWQHHSE
ncbi:MAG TPA: ROK family protein [Flavisolibacter sp.]|nr:ROK family protein [Flavisolibacter sp.]